jgi:hypothetical protein
MVSSIKPEQLLSGNLELPDENPIERSGLHDRRHYGHTAYPADRTALFEKWLEMVAARPAPAKNGEEYNMRLVSLDLTENVAAVKVRDLYLGLWFTDYLSLLKIEDEWVIVNKIFHHESR